MFAIRKDKRALNRGQRKKIASRRFSSAANLRQSFLSFANVTLLLAMLVGCGTQVDGIESADYTPASKTSTPVSAPSETESASVDGSLTIFKNVVAGDYQLLHLSSNGLMEAVRWNRIHQIVEYQTDELPAATVNDLFRLAMDVNSSVAEDMYDVYPLPEGSTLIYEDIYYLLRIDTTDVSRTIITHEAVMPEPLADFVAEAFAICDSMDYQEIAGQFLLAGDRELIGFKRYVREENRITLRSEDLGNYPTLVRLLERQYVIHPVPDISQTELREHFDDGRISLTVELPDLSVDVLLLTAGGE